jgi:D-xylose transport system substrate-binding protein
MSIRRMAAVMSIAAVAFAACSSGSGGSTAPSLATGAAPSVAGSAAAAGCKGGMSWVTFQEERYKNRDEPALKAAIEKGGGTYSSADGKNSAATQASDVETLINSGVDVLLIDAFDDKAILPSVDAALTAGIPVIAYDRLIENGKVLYLTHDNVEVGRMIAREILKQKPSGNFAIMKGDKANPNARFLDDGFQEILKPALDSKAVTIPAGAALFTDGWKPEIAQTQMEQILTANSNKIDAVLSENDGMAGGVIAALKAQGLNGKVAVGGQDGDIAALNNVALGNQAVSIWKNTTELGTAAGEAALALCKDKDVTKVANTAPFATPGGNTVTANLLKPTSITKDNLDVVLDAAWITKDKLCAGVDAATAPAACK